MSFLWEKPFIYFVVCNWLSFDLLSTILSSRWVFSAFPAFRPFLITFFTMFVSMFITAGVFRFRVVFFSIEYTAVIIKTSMISVKCRNHSGCNTGSNWTSNYCVGKKHKSHIYFLWILCSYLFINYVWNSFASFLLPLL